MDNFEEKLKQALDERTEALDAATLSRLHRARVQALQATPPWWRRSAISNRVFAALGDTLTWHPLAALSTVIVMVLGVLLLLPQLNTDNALPDIAHKDTVEIMEIIDLEVDVELVEDLDFYDWLEGQLDQESGA